MNGDYNYQPLVIRAILQDNAVKDGKVVHTGKASQKKIEEEIGKEYPHFLTLENSKELFENLEKNSIIKYNKSDQEYELLNYKEDYEKEKQYQAVLVTKCNHRIKADMRLQGPKFKEWMEDQEAEDWRKDHEEHAKKIRDKLISREIIEKWKEEDLFAIFKELWANNGFGNKKFIPQQLIEDNTLETIRKEIAEVVHGDKPLSERYDKCVKNLKGMRKARLTELLYCYDKNKYPLWNGKAQHYIKKLRLSGIVNQGKTDGQKYQKLIDEFQTIVKTLEPFGAKNFFDLDNFLWHHFPKEEEEVEEEEGRKNYWVCAVGHIDDRNGTWDEIKNETYWGMGWDKMEDLKKYKTDNEILKAFKKAYPQNGKAEKKKTKGQACVDIKKINAGDTLFINDGKVGLFGVGVATGTYEYHPEVKLLHQVPVKWISKQYVEWIK